MSPVFRTVIEEAAAAKKGDALTGPSRTGYDQIKGMLSRGERGRNQHPLTGNLKGKFAADLPGTGRGRGATRVIFEQSNEQVIIHDIENYHK